ncbi:YceI family protein [Tahibacter amnicola]|uniref:YceI family protein n=1 Tax=Tahibacter amnicola TaxID=2976241 RepID=A0ABY6BIX8_9GAMM|nr:YceI family protein [Tahibacter amnicola]UXI69328.1 YceI family protein [Tahibacter amnicola]
MRRVPSALLLILSAAMALPAIAGAPQWRVDTVHTQIHFSLDHQGFSRAMGLIKVRDGQLTFDPDDWAGASLTVTVDPATVILGDAKWEETVRSWQFFNVSRWPLARYSSDSIERVDERRGVVHGHLEWRGERQPLDLAFQVNKVGNDPYTFRRTAGFSATATLRRSAFGMDKLLSVVGDDVKLLIEVEVTRDRGRRDTQAAENSDDGIEK